MIRKKVLIIEDDEEMCDEMAEILRGEGYSVSTCIDGRRGRDIAKEYMYDVVILDLKLPGVSGLEILKSIRSQGSATKVVIVTARPLKADVAGMDGARHNEDEFILRSAACIIEKPFDVSTMVEKLREVAG